MAVTVGFEPIQEDLQRGATGLLRCHSAGLDLSVVHSTAPDLSSVFLTAFPRARASHVPGKRAL